MADVKKHSYIIGRIVGSKTSNYSFLEDNHKTINYSDTEPISLKQDPIQDEYSLIGAFVPGYAKAGRKRDKVRAFFGHKASQRRIQHAKRRVATNFAVQQAGEVVKAARPDIEPEMVDMGTQLGGMAANAGGDWLHNKYDKHKAKKEAKAKADEKAKRASGYYEQQKAKTPNFWE